MARQRAGDTDLLQGKHLRSTAVPLLTSSLKEDVHISNRASPRCGLPPLQSSPQVEPGPKFSVATCPGPSDSLISVVAKDMMF